ncbi:hypothetical protein ACIBI4_00460 [Streptomyces sp. NPDC050418]|uniref:hypothetical protein n=1 Tax=Streptomyces sp. NPDC050418 TaxID=3365612 RepID=UPI0037ACBB69
MRESRPGERVKQLPVAALPDAELKTWSVTDAEQWRAARVPGVFAPVAASWVAIVAVVVAYWLTSAFSDSPASWPGGAEVGTDWLRYPGAALLAFLPLWYRHVPVLAAAAAAIVAAYAAVAVTAADGGVEQAGHLLVLAVTVWLFTGSCLRLRARRTQRALFLAAAGPRRFPLPARVPESDGYRGHAQVYAGAALCLIAAAVLTDGLIGDLSGSTYDAVGHQTVALLLALPGSTLLARGLAAYRAARRLHDEEAHPALRVGIRVAPDGRHWIHPDARIRDGRPMISYAPEGRSTRTPTQLLGSASYGIGDGHHSIDPFKEAFEAVLYGPVHEGAEIVVAYASIAYHYRQETGQMSLSVTTAALLPNRRHRLGASQPVDGTEHERARREKVRDDAIRAERRDEQIRQAQAQRATRAKQAGAGTAGGATAAGCGGGTSGSDSGCGDGGCGGCGGCG